MNNLLLMTREDVINLLKAQANTVQELSTKLGKSTAAIENDLEHIRTTLRNDRENQLLINPAMCSLCGHKFTNAKIKTPTRCPRCSKEKIAPPGFKID